MLRVVASTIASTQRQTWGGMATHLAASGAGMLLIRPTVKAMTAHMSAGRRSTLATKLESVSPPNSTTAMNFSGLTPNIRILIKPCKRSSALHSAATLVNRYWGATKQPTRQSMK